MIGEFERSKVQVVGFLAAAMLAVVPGVAGAQSLASVGLDMPVSENPAAEGAVAVTVTWSPNGTTLHTEGSVPAGAQVASVYLAGAPLGDIAQLGRITLSHDGVSEALVHIDTAGTVSYPTASWPSMAWQSQWVSGQGSWRVVREPVSTSSLELTFVIRWVEAPAASAREGTNRTGDAELSVMDGRAGELDVDDGP